MITRLIAVAILVASALVAWVTVSVPLAARLLQFAIAASMLYVGWLAWQGAGIIRRAIRDARSGAGEPTGLARDLPFVSLVVPARNEAAVIGAAVRDLCALDYVRPDGSPGYEVVVIDDASTDATAETAVAAADGAAHVTVVRREPEPGPRTKGAVLRHAAAFLRGPIVGVVDADSRVDRAFLERAMRAWRRDPAAAALQVARTPRNAGRSWLTRAQAEEQLMDLTSQCGRWAAEGTAELRGNGMFVRADVLEALGGWAFDAATEDLDLSTRLSVAGHHVGLAPEVAVREEAVETAGPLWRQRLRWAEGSIRRLIAHGPALLASPAPLRRKVDFLAFSVEFLLPPLFVAAILASLVTVPLPRPAEWTVPASLFVGYGLGVFLLALGGLHATGVRGPRLVGRAARGALFLSHWLLVVPAALARIALGPGTTEFTPTPRFTGDERP